MPEGAPYVGFLFRCYSTPHLHALGRQTLDGTAHQRHLGAQLLERLRGFIRLFVIRHYVFPL